MNVADFRANFPEFAEEAAYTDAQIAFWATFAELRLNPGAWSDLWPMGVMLYTAHCVVLAKANSKVAAFAGTPGQNTGPLRDKAVKDVSLSYDTAAASIEGAGNYNLTTYGTRYYELMRLVGMGPIQANAGVDVFPAALASFFP